MTDVAIWSQLLSSIAVIGTLIYLAIETKQNTAAQHAATRLGIMSEARADMHRFAEDPDLLLSVSRLEPLQPGEAVRLDSLLHGFMVFMEYIWLQHRAGAIDDYAWNGQAWTIRAILKTKRTERWWQAQGRHYFEPSFVEVVDALVKDAPYATNFDNLLAWGREDLRG